MSEKPVPDQASSIPQTLAPGSSPSRVKELREQIALRFRRASSGLGNSALQAAVLAYFQRLEK